MGDGSENDGDSLTRTRGGEGRARDPHAAGGAAGAQQMPHSPAIGQSGAKGRSPPIDRFALAAVIGGITGVGLALSLSLPLLSVVLERRGVSASLIGINTATAGLAAILILPFVTSLAQRFGTARLILASFATMIVTLLGFYAVEPFILWFPLRFAFAAAVTVIFALTEFWINSLAPDAKRGFIVGIYTAFLSIGIALGPAILALVGTHGFAPFAIGAAALAVAAVPVLLVRGREPDLPKDRQSGLLRFVVLAPAALFAALVFGAVEAGGTAILPLWGFAIGLDERASIILVSAIAAGNIVSQIPIGLLADRMSRRLLLLGCGVVGVVGALCLPLVSQSYALTFIVLFVTGGIVAGLYTVGLTHLGSRYRGAELASVNAAFVMMYAVGMLVGPVTLGAALDAAPPHGFALAIAALFGAYVILTGLRIGARGFSGERSDP